MNSQETGEGGLQTRSRRNPKSFFLRSAILVLAMLVPVSVHAESLVERLISKDPTIRLSAQDELKHLDSQTRGQLVTPVAQWLYDADSEIREHAGFVLFQIGVAAIPALAQAAEKGALATRQAALGAVIDIGRYDWLNPATTDQVIPVLSKALKDSEPDIRLAAATALGDMGSRDHSPARAAIPDLIPLLDDAVVSVRFRAAIALAKLEPHAGKAIPVLTEGLRNEDPFIRSDSAWAMGLMGEEANEAVPPLLLLLKDADDRVQLSAAQALARIDPKVREPIPVLMALLHHRHAGVRSRAAEVLEELVGPGDQEVVRALTKSLGDEDANVRAHAIPALGKIGPAAKDAVPVLIQTLRDANAYEQPSIVWALESIGTPEAITTVERFRKENPSVPRIPLRR